jgi:uncharacterized damage-inducible protein DinB
MARPKSPAPTDQPIESVRPSIADQVLETWRIHDRIHQYLLEGIAQESLDLAIKEKGRTVFKLFAHIHNVRLMWLKASAPELLEGTDKIDTDTGTKTDLAAALSGSGKAIEALIKKGLLEGKIKGFKPHPVAFLGYLISHESHHRGQIGWILKHAGQPLDKKVAFGLWEWGTR